MIHCISIYPESPRFSEKIHHFFCVFRHPSWRPGEATIQSQDAKRARANLLLPGDQLLEQGAFRILNKNPLNYQLGYEKLLCKYYQEQEYYTRIIKISESYEKLSQADGNWSM